MSRNRRKYKSFMGVALLAFTAGAAAQSKRGEAPEGFREVERDSIAYLAHGEEILYRIEGGDMLIPIAGSGSVASTHTFNFWTGGRVHYEYAPTVLPKQIILMEEAFAIIEGIADVQFISGLHVVEGGIIIISTQPDQCTDCDCLNNATVGAALLGRVNICNWRLKTILHELGHVLNLKHEQTRPDRDTFVEINWDNIQESKVSNFYRGDTQGMYGPYDFESLMHYSQCTFSTCDDCPNDAGCEAGGTVITVLPPNESFQSDIGRKSEFSPLDRLTLSFLYPQDDWYFVDQDAEGSQVGTFLEPWQSFVTGMIQVPDGGTLWIQPGDYVASIGVFDNAVMLEAPLGELVVGGN